MTTFNGRRTLNVSQFLANGNTVSPPTDVASDNGFTDFDNDLARFTNVDFTQVDLNDEGLFNLDGEGRGQREYEGQKGESSRSQNGEVLETEGRGLDFVNAGYPFQGTNPFDLPASPSTLPQQPGQPEYPPLPFSGYPTPNQQPFAPDPYPGAKRQSSSISTTNPFPSAPSPAEDNPIARQAAEEDRRRRNTAASARFRVKKKQREQALEKTAEELKARAQELEAKVGQLQKENEWLRGLVVVRGDVAKEKADGEGEDVKRRADENNERIARSEARKGVGTKREVDDEEAGDG